MRQAENTGLIKAAIKIFEEDKTFSGMPELYFHISREEVGKNKFVLVSAISNWFDGRIEKFLVQSNYPSNHRILRNWLTEWSIQDFKILNIRNILNEYPNKKFIVIFDNSGASLELAGTLQIEFPGKISAIYLRQVVNKSVPIGATSFFTAFDIALNEFKSQRLNVADVAAVGNAIATDKDSENIFPEYAVCPAEYNPCLEVGTDLVEICSKVKKRVMEVCSKR